MSAQSPAARGTAMATPRRRSSAPPAAATPLVGAWLSFLCLTLLAICATAMHGPVFGSSLGYIAAGAGAAAGLLLAAAGARWRLSALEVGLLSIVVYLLIGGAAAVPTTTSSHVIPTLTTLRVLVIGAIHAWKDLLTVSPPAGAFVGPAIVPLLSQLLAGVVSGSIALRSRRPGWAVLPWALSGLIAAAWGSQQAPYALAIGAAAAAVGLVWGALIDAARRRRSFAAGTVSTSLGSTPDSSASATPGGSAAAAAQWRRLRLRAGMSAALTYGVAGLIAVLALPLLLGGQHRDVLRDYIRPPLDVREYHTPLASYHRWLDEQKDATIFTLEGMQKGDRLRLATLDSYDGVIMRVGSGQAGEEFRHVGETFTDSPSQGNLPTRRVEVTVGDYDDHWVPAVGIPRQLRFTGERADTLRENLYFSVPLATMLDTQSLREGDRFTVEGAVSPQWSDAQLEGLSMGQVSQPVDENVPEAISARLSDFMTDTSSDLARIRSIEQNFIDMGFYSDGTDGRSRPGHRSSRLSDFLDPDTLLVGDDEQYAVAMALMVRAAGYPARVAVGFYPEVYADGPQIIAGTDAHVWVEVLFDGAGWVPFDPTPPRDKTPQTQTPQPKPNPRPQVIQPPVPPQDPGELLDDTVNEPQHDKAKPPAWLKWLRLGAMVLGGTLLLLAPFLLIIALKARRRRRRRTHGSAVTRAVGAWYELLDRMRDLGVNVSDMTTRRSQAQELARRYAAQSRTEPASDEEDAMGVVAMAEKIDAAAYGPDPADSPVNEQIALQAWEQLPAALAAVSSHTSRRRRLLASIHPATLGHRPRSGADRSGQSRWGRRTSR